MLKLIFRGFFEWIYGLLMDIWWFITDGLLDIMSLDFAYLQSHIPIIPQLSQLLMAVGWALLLGNLVFQALKSMVSGLGFEGENPKLLFSRTFVFAFLLMASPQICRIGLDLTSRVMDLLSLPDATEVGLVDESVFGAMTAAWLMAIICSVIVMFKVLGLVIELAERYVILAMLTITAPLAFAMGGSKNTSSIFTGWCRMFGSMCLLTVTNLVCCKMLFSTVSTVPSGIDVLPWMVLVFAIVKVAKKSDAIITRIGLNPAVIGEGKSLLGTLINTVLRMAVGGVVKGIGIGGIGGMSAKTPSSGTGLFTRFSGGNAGGGRYNPHSPGSAGGGYTYQNSSRQNTFNQSASTQTDSQQDNTVHGGGPYTGTRQENSFQSSTQQSTGGGSVFNSGSRTSTDGGQHGPTRRSSVPPGTRRSPGHVPPASNTTQTPGASNAHAPSGQSGTSVPRQPDSPRPGVAGTTAPRGGTANAAKSQPGPAGTGAPPTRSTQIKGGNTVHNSAQTNVTAGKDASGTAGTRRPHPSGSTASASPPNPNRARRSPKRENTDAASKTPTAPTTGSVQPGTAGKAARSTHRPSESASRPGRNVSPATAASPADGTSSGTTRQETRKPAASASSSTKGGAPTVRSGAAGTARTGQRAAGTKQPAAHSSKRAQPSRRPPPRG